ncbi:MAG: UxaA family hydrolase [Anaerovoracaceae bacterium]
MKDMFALKAHEKDNVATVFGALQAGAQANVEDAAGASTPVTAVDDIPYGHKIALVQMSAGTDILKYGEVIGRTTGDIAVGAHVHVQNVASLRGRGDVAAANSGGASHEV